LHVLADDRGRLEKSLGLGPQAVDARGQDGLNGGGDLQVLGGSGEPVGAALTGQGRRLHQSPHTVLEEEGEPPERAECHVSAEERIEQLGCYPNEAMTRGSLSEVIFLVEEAPEGGFTARALGESIFTEADSVASLHDKVRDAVRCHFDEGQVPKVIRLHFVREEIITA
jgi:hypothetical protein